MDIAALIEQLIPFLMELIGGIISMVTSMASENSGVLKAGAAASIIGGAAMTADLGPAARPGVDAAQPPPPAAEVFQQAPEARAWNPPSGGRNPDVGQGSVSWDKDTRNKDPESTKIRRLKGRNQ